MKKFLIVLLFFLWLAVLLTIFFVVQKPDFLNVIFGLKNLLFIILIPFWMIILSACFGSYVLPDIDPTERLILGNALGLGFFGLAGFGLAAGLGWAKADILWPILLALTIFFILTGKLKQIREDTAQVIREIKSSANNVSFGFPIIVVIACVLSFILSLAPPVEDFDALFYHLAVPSWWLRDGGLAVVAIPHYWFPQIVEGSFVWPMVLGVDTATHLIHFTWFILTILLLWHWARQLWEDVVAWDVLLILLTMPSLLWLAAWAYTDYALTFMGLATLYSLWRWQNTQKIRWLFVSSVMAGLAVSVKYTGFVVPLTGVLLVMFWEHGLLQRLKKAIYFSVTTTLVASPWYLRNWIWMKNPLYPFIFEGRFWDSFLAQAYSASGSGIELDAVKLLALPLTATLGIQDVNFFDGRIGPFILILSPLTLWVFWEARHEQSGRRSALFAIGLFSFISIAAWTVGVINSASLFQTRLLFPALIPLAIPLALGLNLLYRLDTSWMRISFIARFMLSFVVLVNLLNFSLQILVRDPVSVVVGLTSQQEYTEKRQSGYAHLLTLMKDIPENTKVYFLFEPRSYGINAQVQPDAINANFSHDLWLYKTPKNIITAWRQQGYTHVVVSKLGADFIFQSQKFSQPQKRTRLNRWNFCLNE